MAFLNRLFNNNKPKAYAPPPLTNNKDNTQTTANPSTTNSGGVGTSNSTAPHTGEHAHQPMTVERSENNEMDMFEGMNLTTAASGTPSQTESIDGSVSYNKNNEGEEEKDDDDDESAFAFIDDDEEGNDNNAEHTATLQTVPQQLSRNTNHAQSSISDTLSVGSDRSASSSGSRRANKKRRKRKGYTRPGFAREDGDEDVNRAPPVHSPNPTPNESKSPTDLDFSGLEFKGKQQTPVSSNLEPVSESEESKETEYIEGDVKKGQIENKGHNSHRSGEESGDEEIANDEGDLSSSQSQSYTSEWFRVKEDLDRELGEIQGLSMDVLQRQYKALKRKQEIAARLCELQNEIDEANTQQQEAVDAEEYERAEKLNEEIESRNKENSLLDAELQNLQKALESCDADKQHLPSKLIRAHERIIRRLGDLKYMEEKGFEEFMDEIQMRTVSAKERLQDEEERLSRLNNNIILDLKDLENRRGRIQDRIDDQTKSIQEVRDEASSKVLLLDDEIVELRRLLKQKEEERTKAQNVIDQANVKIERVRTKFQRELQHLSQEEESTDQRLKDCENLKNNLSRDRKEFETEQSIIEEEKLARSEVIKAITEQIQESNTRIVKLKRQDQELSQARRKRKRFQEIEKQELQQVETLRIRQRALDSGVAEAKKRIALLQADCAALRKSISLIDERLPLLERDKNLAVSSRQFKEASAISKEIKELQNKKLENEKKLESTFAQLSTDEESIQEEESRLEELNTNIEEREKEIAIQKIEHLLKDLLKFEDLIQSFASEEYSSGERSLIESEIDIIKSDIDEIKSKYHMSAELVQQLRDSISSKDEESERLRVATPELSNDDKGDEQAERNVDDLDNEESKPVQDRTEAEGDNVTPAENIVDKTDEDSKEVSPIVVDDKLDAAQLETLIKEMQSQINQLEVDLETNIAEENFDECELINGRIEDVTFQLEKYQKLLGQYPEQHNNQETERESTCSDNTSNGSSPRSQREEDYSDGRFDEEVDYPLNSDEDLGEESGFDFLESHDAEESDENPSHESCTDEDSRANTDESAFNFMNSPDNETASAESGDSSGKGLSAFDFIEGGSES